MHENQRPCIWLRCLNRSPPWGSDEDGPSWKIRHPNSAHCWPEEPQQFKRKPLRAFHSLNSILTCNMSALPSSSLWFGHQIVQKALKWQLIVVGLCYTHEATYSTATINFSTLIIHLTDPLIKTRTVFMVKASRSPWLLSQQTTADYLTLPQGL